MDLRRLNSVSETPKFQYESISTVCNQVRPHDSLITDRYRERLSPYSGASGRQKIPRHSLERSLVSMNCSPVRTPRKPVFNILQNIAASNSVPASTWFTTRRIRRRNFTHGHPDLVRAPQAAFTDHVNAFGVFNKLGKVFPSASSQKEFIGYVVNTDSTDSYPMIKVPATRILRLRHDIRRTLSWSTVTHGTCTHSGTVYCYDKSLVPGKLLVRNAYRLLGRRSSWDSPLLLDGPTRDDLTRWYHALESWNGRPIKTKTSRSSTRHRCFTNRMGSSSQWKAGNRLLGQTSSANAFKLTRVVGHPSSHKSFRERLKVQKSASVIWQRCGCGLHQPFGWPHPRYRGPGFGSLNYHLRVRNQAFHKATGGQRKCPCRPPVSSVTTLRMAASPTPV